MFEWVPYFEGKMMTYHQFFAFVACVILLVVAILSLLLMLILKEVIKLISKKKIQLRKNGEIERIYQDDNEMSYLQGQQQQNNNNQEQIGQVRLITYPEPTPECLQKTKDSLQKAVTFLWNTVFIALSGIPLVCGALNLIPTFMSIVDMFGIYALKYALDNIFSQKKRNIIIFFLKLVPWCLIFPLFMHNTCLCFYNSEIGYYSEGLGWALNTQLTRKYQLPEACPPGPPCHVYATVPEDTTTAFFLNFHTSKKTKSATVFYDSETYFNQNNKTLRYNVNATTYKIVGIEKHGKRNVHSALITDLTPNTRYVVQIYYDDSLQYQYIYKTVPDSQNITMINAGDSGTTGPAKLFNQILGTLNPDIFFVGGDIAYDDNFNACYYTWDFYIGELEKIFQQTGYIFPVVLAVGNHDVGLNENPGINITQNLEGPQFLNFFPQHYKRDSNFQIVKEIPPIGQRSTIFYHKFGNSIYISLDSGYLHDFSGWQEQLLVKWLSENPNTYKFIHYHVPIYSVCAYADKGGRAILGPLFHWVPHFDRFRVITAYENHVHAFKRTKPLVGNYPAAGGNGTVYLGDGAYGAIPNPGCALDQEINIFQTMAEWNNFWVTQILPDRLEHRAYGLNGLIIDRSVQKADYYLEI